ncbi:hypothetical protein MXB_3328 [Myxobolus squamalis]|nr:hypothetical protein MXB_3328 [Myxobolus squamalis]
MVRGFASFYHRLTIWTSDEVLAIVWIITTICVDASFRVIPSLFVQCLIIKLHNLSKNFVCTMRVGTDGVKS